MPPAASGMSSSYLPRRAGNPPAAATAGTFKIVSSQGFQVKQSPLRAPAGPGCDADLLTGERHVGYAERRRGGRAAQLEIVGDQVDPLEDLVEVRRDRDLADRERQLAALDPEALCAPGEVARHGVE